MILRVDIGHRCNFYYTLIEQIHHLFNAPHLSEFNAIPLAAIELGPDIR